MKKNLPAIPKKNKPLPYWVVWISKKDNRFRACPGHGQFAAEMTARVLTKPGAHANGVDLNYANQAWALQAPTKGSAIQICQVQWHKSQLSIKENANVAIDSRRLLLSSEIHTY